MSNSIYLILGCHSHQPVGNFEHVLDWAYRSAYLPFLDVLERFPAVNVTLHYTGPLLDWLADHQPGYLERMAGLVKNGQIEIMGGGYYEPLLCAIPQHDSVAQIHRMAEFCDKHFGTVPKGMWLAERVWEPHMARIMAQAGIEYTALDDTHFLCSGIPPEELFGYYVTEDEGYSVKVFPILEYLRYSIPFHPVHESIEFLRRNATEDGTRCAVIHDDGEKFGVWPGTNRSVYEEGWLEQFFQALTDNREWLHCITYSEYMARVPARGRTYLACASYEEMMEWALPTPMHCRLKRFREQIRRNPDWFEDQKLFIRGGFWRQFLAKYDESNNIHKRMLRTSRNLQKIKSKKDDRVRQAELLLHQGQCNCAYWHGQFGGLYLNHLRTALYEKLIESDAILDGVRHKNDNWVNCETLDFDGDGRDEVVLENAVMSLFFSPADGGTLFEWDYKRKPFNLGNVLTRRPERYHDILREGGVVVGEVGSGSQSIHELAYAKEAGLENYLVYDPYRRVSLRDHFLAETVAPEELWSGVQQELSDVATGLYDRKVGRDRLTLERLTTVNGAAPCPVRVTKSVRLCSRASEFEIRYDVRNEGNEPFHALFGVELVVNFLTGSAPDRYYWSNDADLHHAQLGVLGSFDGLTHLALRDEWKKLDAEFSFSRTARVFTFALETVSQSEGGQERVYQGSVIVPCWSLRCAPGETSSWTIKPRIKDLELE